MRFRNVVLILVLAGGLFALIPFLKNTDSEKVVTHTIQPVREQKAVIKEKVVEQKVPEKVITQEDKPVKPKVDIFRFDNPQHLSVLNTPTQPVKKLPDPDIDAFIKTMHSSMISNIGGGISANQLGKPWQIFLIAPPPMVTTSAPSELFINPVITKASKARSCFWHGCLSSKGDKFGKVATWNTVTIKALDAKGKEFARELKGLDAIVAQHEFRHLLGGGYHDHAKEFEDEMALYRLMIQGKAKMIEPCDESAPFLLEGYQVGETIEQYAQRQNGSTPANKKTASRTSKSD